MKKQKTKTFFLIAILLCFFTIQSSAQNKADVIKKKHDIEFINNKIKFNVGWPKDRDKLSVKLSSSQFQKIELLTCDELLVLLKDNKTDWAINLILYSLYEKDAWLFSECCDNTRKKWLRFSKDNDIKFWTEKFNGYESSCTKSSF